MVSRVGAGESKGRVKPLHSSQRCVIASHQHVDPRNVQAQRKLHPSSVDLQGEKSPFRSPFAAQWFDVWYERVKEQED
jgi:hypothetical protein